MAGTGPPPKHPSARARRNRVAGAAVLTPPDPKTVEIPDLPVRNPDDDEFVGWHRQTVEWWRDLWSSPMSSEYDESDLHGLYVLVVLVDDFWRKPSQALAAEIRLQQRQFGLNPMARRGLNWTIERPPPEIAVQEPAAPKKRAAKKNEPAADDPRVFLRVV